MWFLRRNKVSSVGVPQFNPAVLCRADILPETPITNLEATEAGYEMNSMVGSDGLLKTRLQESLPKFLRPGRDLLSE